MPRIPLGTSDYARSLAETPPIALFNRFFESDPTNQTDQVSLLVRPGLRKWMDIGTGPIRAIYSQPGSFEDALFVVSGIKLYKIETNETVTELGTIEGEGAVSMAATAYPFNLFIANGMSLKLYTEESASSATLTASGAIADTNVVEIGGVYYKWTSGAVDTGTPAGTVGNPWLVALGANNTEALANLFAAINDSGTEGATYSTALVVHAEVHATGSNATTLSIGSLAGGGESNTITTTETGANISWGGGTMAGGGETSLTEVEVPDGDGIVSVGFIAGSIICVVAQGENKNGQFYWIEPGAIIIDPLNFATAERSPDPVWQVEVSGDVFWLPGTSTNEIWFPTGDALAPFLRRQGRLFDNGIWEGTILTLKGITYAVGTDGTVYANADTPQIISTPGIAQRFREAINAARGG